MTLGAGHWSGGLAEWTEGDTAFLPIAFSWRLKDAFSRAIWHRYRVAGAARSPTNVASAEAVKQLDGWRLIAGPGKNKCRVIGNN